MIEVRSLTRYEFERLMEEADPYETMFLRDLKNNSGKDPYEFMSSALSTKGLVINNRPIYIASIARGNNNRNIFWTVVNSNVTDKITLCKYAKRNLSEWIEQFKEIYATMQKENKENMKWVEWLGFRKVDEDKDTITYKLGE